MCPVPSGYIFMWLWWLILISMSCLSHQIPEITISKEQIRDIGENVQFECIVKNLGNLAVTWNKLNPTGPTLLAMRNALSIENPRYKLTFKNDKEKSITYYNLEINDLETADMGIYECHVILSSDEVIKKEVNLLIKHSPTIVEDESLNSYIVTEGKDVTISCIAKGYPRPTISWKRENDAIMPMGGEVYVGNDLKIKSVHHTDRGIYYCIADNLIGEPAKKPITLEVEFQPHIKATRPKVAQAKNYGIDLECKVEAYPAPVVEWYKNGKQIQSDGNYRITNIATAHEITTSVLRIYGVENEDYGDFQCNATNKIGTASTTITLFKPVIPVPSNYAISIR